jgi:hypothetical protein
LNRPTNNGYGSVFYGLINELMTIGSCAGKCSIQKARFYLSAIYGNTADMYVSIARNSGGFNAIGDITKQGCQ